MKRQTSLILSTGILTLGLVSTAGAELHSRLGGLAYYDDQLDITWAANASISGLQSWGAQTAWVESLNIAGVTGWRLPDMDINGDGHIVHCANADPAECADNEYSFLYWQEGITINAQGPFTNISNFCYWSRTDYPVDNPTDAWCFEFTGGQQGGFTKLAQLAAWAVRSGDVGSGMPDADEDGVPDDADNCLDVANSDQTDTNLDQIGNACDPDVAGPGGVGFDDCAVNFLDLNAYKLGFFGNDAELDLTGPAGAPDGIVNFADLNVVKSYFFGPPGPSAAGCN